MTDDGKVFIIVTHGPDTPQWCATPFYMAHLAAVMEHKARIVCQVDAVLLMKKGIAANLKAAEGGKLIIDFIRDACQAGVEMFCCSAALQSHGITEDELIDECGGIVGGGWTLNQSMAADLVLNY